jgi:hypothetical protein
MLKELECNFNKPDTRRSDPGKAFNFASKNAKSSQNNIANMIKSKSTTSRSYAAKIQYKKARRIKRAHKPIISPKVSPIRKVLDNSRSAEVLERGSSFCNIFQSCPDLKIEYEEEVKPLDPNKHKRHLSQEELLNLLSPEEPKIFTPPPNNTSFNKASFHSSPEKYGSFTQLELKYQQARMKIKQLEEGYKELLYVFHKSEDENRKKIAWLQNGLNSRQEVPTQRSNKIVLSSCKNSSDSKSTEASISYWLNSIMRELRSMNKRISHIEDHISIPK